MHHTTAWGAIPTLVQQNLAAANFPTVTGVGESVAVIDTGINYSNPALGAGFGRHHKVVAGWNFIDNDNNVMDTDGHGTAVASVIGANPFIYNGQRYQGVAQGVNLIALKVDDGVNNPPASRVGQALQWVLDNRRAYNIVAINLSEGNGDFYNNPTTESDYGDLLAQLRDAGVFIAASSGNNGDSSGVEYPSADPNSVSVGSINAGDDISDFTSTGDTLDLLAPGENVPVIVGNGYAPGSGTSFSTPWAAGLAALLRQVQPTYGVSRLLAYMQSTGTRVTDPSNGQTYRRINIDSALNSVYLAYRRSQASVRSAAVGASATPAASVAPALSANASANVSARASVTSASALFSTTSISASAADTNLLGHDRSSVLS